MFVNSLLVSDAYKQSHIYQYPEGTSLVYSNWTPRSDKYAKTKDGVVVFGIQAFWKKIKKHFHANFFALTKEEAVRTFAQGYKAHFGEDPNTSHVEALHDLGYLPLAVKALPEGTICPIGVPMLTIWNTIPEFYWLPNSLETIMSTELWLPMTSATISRAYAKIAKKYSDKTCDNGDHLPFQNHDFSMRGMSGLEPAMASGAGHLLFSKGTDTIPAVDYFVEYYEADKDLDFIGCSIPATEHSVMSMGTKDDELGTFRRLVTQIYPKGLVSIVSDTWDLWRVCTEYLPALKDEILARDGRVVIRPDSGVPEDIICGTLDYSNTFDDFYDASDYLMELRYNEVEENFKVGDQWYRYENTLQEMIEDYGWDSVSQIMGIEDEMISNGIITPISPSFKPEELGVIELLWETFGGTVNSKGYKVLNPCIGAIYGDSITLERAEEIFRRLEAKGFASSDRKSVV